MIITQKDLDEQREQMQQDILCVLDGIDDQKLIDSVCQVVVDRFAILSGKLAETKKENANV